MHRRERDKGRGTRDGETARDKGQGTGGKETARDKGRGKRDKGITRDKGRGTRDKGTDKPTQIPIVRSLKKLQRLQGLNNPTEKLEIEDKETDLNLITNRPNKLAPDPRSRKRISQGDKSYQLWDVGYELSDNA
jgi:hypothetical protein